MLYFQKWINREKDQMRRHSPEQVATLKQYWDRGMKSSGTPECKRMVVRAAGETGLSERQVKV